MTGPRARTDPRTGPRASPRAPLRPRSLRTRLVVSAIALIALVCAVIGTVTTVALHSYLYEQLDGGLHEVAARESQAKPKAGPPGVPEPRDPLRFLAFGGSDLGTIGAVVENGDVGEAAVSEEPAERGERPVLTALDAGQKAALDSVPKDRSAHNVDVPGLGEYRVLYVPDGTEGELLVGSPTKAVEDTVSTLIVVELCVAGAGLVAAGIAGATMIGIALRPLRRVASTATRVAQLPLHSGEPALHERVPDADPRTEVGQVGAALNRMLDHVHGALSARQESETRVRQFVADASHELRTPLASIRGYAELTRRGREETGPDTRHALGRIESEAARMTGLVEDLLLLARLDAGRRLAYASTDLSPLVVDAVGDARAAGQRHRWRLELPEEPALVRADAARLQQVLVNLLANARTHTPPGTTVTARVRTDGPDVRLEVEDDGPGIAPELLPRVFERFARGDASRSRAADPAAGHAGSTGLGLAIVQAVVAAHGGAVTVTSVPGRTVFAVRLPAEEWVPDRPSPSAEEWVPDPPAPMTAGPVSGRVSGPVSGRVSGSISVPPNDSQTGHSLTTQP
ncbi:HAMP domain-containing sensor histidine kinase [Streptomyces sp. LHD-70]|uniref:sensor histidine kinase n=1 Tax=Streptomyces sp. LHD-70 TaxID=3072140 RepID=UPI0028109994|nr:HAMP domain-containing sensor histidine kinase [Streptomyces sp. LHD-70]MDQ8705907.1 HAMP domain-containing sensor histidine kinase [Streptomyces sp. LHD-70]